MKALENYTKAMEKSPKDPRIPFNAGNALYRLEEFDKAAEAFDSVAENKKTAPAAFYNKGNALFKKGEYKQAAQAYRQAVLIDPEDLHAKQNLQLALEKLKTNRKQDKKKEDKKDDSKKQQKDQSQGQPPPKPDQPRDRSGMSKEDAERIFQMMKEKEKASIQPDMLNSRARKGAPEREKPEEDW